MGWSLHLISWSPRTDFFVSSAPWSLISLWYLRWSVYDLWSRGIQAWCSDFILMSFSLPEIDKSIRLLLDLNVEVTLEKEFSFLSLSNTRRQLIDLRFLECPVTWVMYKCDMTVRLPIGMNWKELRLFLLCLQGSSFPWLLEGVADLLRNQLNISSLCIQSHHCWEKS